MLVAAPGALAVVAALAAWAMSFDLHPDDTGYPRVLATVLLGFGVWNIVADLRERAAPTRSTRRSKLLPAGSSASPCSSPWLSGW